MTQLHQPPVTPTITTVDVVQPQFERSVGQAKSPAWTNQYRAVLIGVDVCCLMLATLAGFLIRFGSLNKVNDGAYLGIGAAIAAIWLACMLATGAYELRHLAGGPEEYKRVLRASALTGGITAVYCYLTQLDLARGFVAGVIPLGAVFLWIGRTCVRKAVARLRLRGAWSHRILAVGTKDSVLHLAGVAARSPHAGLVLVGACVEDAPIGTEIAPGVPVVGGVLRAAESADLVGADVVALAGSGLGPTGIRELGWQLEGTCRDLVMAPGLTEVAGPRVHVSPVDGLPLMWVDQPQFSGLSRVVKRATDIVGAIFGLLLALPLLCVVALMVKVTSRGPVFFRQSRLGIHGREFMVLKFRSMYRNAEARRVELIQLNENDGVLFKMRRDPRVTPVGRWIRRLSLDEIPQLFNVLRGEMSLVGPRPLATSDSTYTGSARRRLLVRPGITGLWQVSGRSDLTWDDAVRLDLFYVENWSLGLDFSIVLRTVVAVLRAKGAY